MVIAPDMGRDIQGYVDTLAPALIDLSHRIHANPELGLLETKASAWCAELLRSYGFEVVSPLAGMETAFRASKGAGRPAVSFLAEYDALPGVGHACGHNVIGASAVGAGIALAAVLEKAGLGATVIVDGTPAEETVGGKIPLVEQGLYKDIDAVISMHPDTRGSVGGTCLAVKSLVFSFHGKSAHAAAEPEKGINALDAVIQTFNNINALRQHVKPDARIHGIVTQGGRASNIVPDFAEAEFSVRAADMGYLRDLLERVRNCARAAATATGARLDIAEEPTFEPAKDNRTLSRLGLEVLAELSIPAEDHSGRLQPASTDFGNVSQALPAVVFSLKIAPSGTVCHHADFARAAASTEADACVVSAAKAMAILGARLVGNPEVLKEAWAEFRQE